MKVFKFGGASVKDAGSVRNMAAIVGGYRSAELVIVVSAMDKTTNRLEELTAAWVRNMPEKRETAYSKIRDYHLGVLEELLHGNRKAAESLKELFTELHHIINQEPPADADRAYERVVPFGELASSLIIWNYLSASRIALDWLDARQLIITDSTWRDARIHWDVTVENLQSNLEKRRSAGSAIAITQGFIGSNGHGQTTTLGREGSDFSAAIIAYALDADEVVIWKDVPGLMNADPALFPDAELLESISFHEAIELAYYGAKVIHPRTIKPLQNKNIPLRVKSFKDPEAPGSIIHALENYDQEIPSYIIKENQTLLSFSPRDFSFMDEKNLSEIFASLSGYNIRVNLMQNSAISFSVCIDDHDGKLERITSALRDRFKIRYNKHLTLITIRHFTDDIITRFHNDANVLLEQRSRNTVQMVVKG